MRRAVGVELKHQCLEIAVTIVEGGDGAVSRLGKLLQVSKNKGGEMLPNYQIINQSLRKRTKTRKGKLGKIVRIHQFRPSGFQKLQM